MTEEREYHVACVDCGEELQPGDAAIAAITGMIESDGGFYLEEMEPWLWVRHAQDCQNPMHRAEAEVTINGRFEAG